MSGTPLTNPRVRRALFSDTPSKRARTTKSSVTRTVRRLAETKYNTLEGPWLQGVTANLGTNVEISSLSQGDNVSNRDGLKVTCTRLIAHLSGVGTGPMRVVVYCPKDPAASLAADTDFDAISPADHWVLHDKMYYNADLASLVHINLPLNHKIEWSSGTATAWRRNPVRVLIVKGGNGAGSVINGFVRLYFKDV